MGSFKLKAPEQEVGSVSSCTSSQFMQTDKLVSILKQIKTLLTQRFCHMTPASNQDPDRCVSYLQSTAAHGVHDGGIVDDFVGYPSIHCSEHQVTVGSGSAGGSTILHFIETTCVSFSNTKIRITGLKHKYKHLQMKMMRWLKHSTDVNK